jgi:hypothetical protein
MAKSFSIALWCLFFATLISLAKAENTKFGEDKATSIAGINQIPPVELAQGMYGVPLNAPLSEVLAWCEKNNLIIRNETQNELKKSISDNITYINKGLDGKYDPDESFSVLEAKLRALLLPDPCNVRPENLFVKMLLARLHTLETVSFNYKGKKYCLDIPFAQGFPLTVDGKECLCQDNRITDSICMLMAAPERFPDEYTGTKGKSAEFDDDGLYSFGILFSRDANNAYKSYFAAYTFRSGNLHDLNGKLLKIVGTLNIKYGTCGNLVADPCEHGNKIEDTAMAMTDYLYSISSLNAMEDRESVDFLIWRKNIFLYTELEGHNYNRGVAGYDPYFTLIYYDDKAGKEVYSLHKQVLDDFKANLKRKQ